MGLRRQELCPGGAHTCARSRHLECQDCGHTWRLTGDNRRCPECGSSEAEHIPCDECFKERLAQEEQGPLGQILARASSTMRMIELGLSVSAELPADEYCAMRIIAEEREKLQAKAERDRAEAAGR
jgi:hypothetical protein